ncbi:hypothetical protein ACVWXO_007710 [Bradyrhizobium sp. LM2.7]
MTSRGVSWSDRSLAADRHPVGWQVVEMDLESHSRRRRMLTDFRHQHGVGQAFRKAAALHQAEPAGGCRHGDDGQGVLPTIMTFVIFQ